MNEYEDRCDIPRSVAQDLLRWAADLEADLHCMTTTGEPLDPKVYQRGAIDLVRELTQSIAALQYVQAARFREANLLPPAARIIPLEHLG